MANRQKGEHVVSYFPFAVTILPFWVILGDGVPASQCFFAAWPRSSGNHFGCGALAAKRQRELLFGVTAVVSDFFAHRRKPGRVVVVLPQNWLTPTEMPLGGRDLKEMQIFAKVST